LITFAQAESETNLLLIALVVLVPALLLWSIFIARTRRSPRPGGVLGIPQALRPGDPDEILEGRRLERIQAAGLIATLATAVFIPAYWLPESDRQESFAERFEEESHERGALIVQKPPEIPEDADPQVFRESEHALALGMSCVNCHGGVDEENPERSLGGGQVPGGWTDPTTGEVVSYEAPPLQNVFQRWDEEIIRMTIERGRPGTPMPTWGVEFGGPMTQQMVDDVIAYLKTLPGNQNPPPELSEGCEDPAESDYLSCGEEIFETRCAVCHGPEGQGKEATGSLNDPTTPEEEPNDPWYPGLPLWKGDVRHLEPILHKKTVNEGRRFQWMPPFGEAPPQGIPVPPYPLTESQIDAVVAYERSL
jgi:mono/diheme cytochrome c family protein